MSTPRPPIDILVVGWFPAADSVFAGRFVADQVEALRATGRVRPWLASFENIPLRGSPGLRDREASAVANTVVGAIERGRAWAPAGASGPAEIPVARLGVAAGATTTSGGDFRAVHRTGPLMALVERPDRPDWRLVHAHVGYPEGAAAAEAARRLGIPLVVTEHASYIDSFLADPVVRTRYLQALNAADRVIAVSHVLAREIAAAAPAIADRIAVIPNAVAIRDFRAVGPAARRADELLWVGQRSESKGIDLLLRAFRIVVRDRPNMTLRLIGRSRSDEEEAGWRRLASELGIGPAVRFEASQERAGVAAAMERATLFVHPSHRETFGVVAAEALATGLPVVATESGGVTEILGADPDALGALVTVREPQALAAAIVRTLDRRDVFDPAVLRAGIEARYSARVVAEQVADVYDQVIEAHPASAQPLGWSGAPEPERGPFMIVSFERAALDRALAAFPPWVFAGVGIVTSGHPVPDRGDAVRAPEGADRRVAALTGWGSPDRAGRGRLDRLARRSIRIGARLVRRGPDEDAIVAELRATIARALTNGSDGPPVLVCQGGIDHLVAAPFFEDGRARPAPGGLRWLADARSGERNEPD